MKKLIKSAKNLFSAILDKIDEALVRVSLRSRAIVADNTGDAAVDTLGKIIIALILVAALIAVVRTVAPTLFTNVFDKIGDEIEALWDE